MISSGKFDDIYVGDYITTNEGNNKVTWLIADLDNYLYSGDTQLIQHHATIIPATPLENAKMNETNDTTGGYYGSQMVQETLTNVLNKYIQSVFGEHILKYKNNLSNSVDDNLPNKYNVKKGASDKAGWYERQLDLMSEVNVYGTTVWSSSPHDIGIDNRQYAIFQIKPEFINSYGTSRFGYWLKDIAYSADFSYASGHGISVPYGASNSFGVRPRFLID